MSDTVDTTTRSETVESPSLASRVASHFDKAVESKEIGFATPSEVKKSADKKPSEKPVEKAEKKPEAKAEAASDESEIEESETDEEETPEAEKAGSESKEDDTDPEFKEAADKHGVPLSLDDIPEEARPLVQKKLKDMERGFTKAMQEQRSYRAEKAEFDANKKYETEKPEQYYADKLLADPKLLAKVNEEITKREDPVYRDAVAKERDNDVREARLTAREQIDTERARIARTEHLESYTADAAKTAGIPFTFVEEAVALAVMANPNVTDAEITALVASKAKAYKQYIGANKGAAKRDLTKAIASDAKNAGLKDVPATAARSSASRSAAGVTTESKPMTLREKLEATLDERAAA